MGLPNWTPYAKEMALRYILHLTPAAAPTNLYVALYSDTADPTASGIECIDSGYSRKPVTWLDTVNPSVFFEASSVDAITMVGNGLINGVALVDAATGAANTFFWQDLDTEYDYVAGADVHVLASGLRVGIVTPS